MNYSPDDSRVKRTTEVVFDTVIASSLDVDDKFGSIVPANNLPTRMKESRRMPFPHSTIDVVSSDDMLAIQTSRSERTMFLLYLFVPPTRVLLLEMLGVALFTVLTAANACTVFPSPQELDEFESGDLLLALRIGVGSGILFPCFWGTMFVYVVLLRQACLNQETSVEAMDCGSSIVGVLDEPTRELPPLIVDAETLRLTVTFALVPVCVITFWIALAGHKLSTFATGLVWAYGLFRFLPAACHRWNPSGGAHFLISVVRRSLMAGLPMIVLPRIFPPLLKPFTPDDVTFFYPVLISFWEYLMVSRLFNNNVVAGHGDEALSMIARITVAVCEPNRIGLLVVVSNSASGSFGGLINATIMGVVFDALARNNLISITWRATRYGLRWLWCKLVSMVLSKPWRAPPRTQRLNSMGRFKRVYLGVKLDTEYWGVYMLILIKALGWGFGGPAAPSMNHETGELLDILDSSWHVIAVVAVGELAGDILTLWIGWFMRRYAPEELQVVVPVITPKDVTGVVVVVMWMNVGGLYLHGISSMGKLSDILSK